MEENDARGLSLDHQETTPWEGTQAEGPLADPNPSPVGAGDGFYTTYREDIAYLNEIEDRPEEETALIEADPSPYGSLHQEASPLLAAFEPEALETLTFLGLSDGEEGGRSGLEDLAAGVPIKVAYQMETLGHPLVLLVKPELTAQNRIHLTVMPYLKISHPLTIY